jgi:DNA-binding Xre family transcriptional regulator
VSGIVYKINKLLESKHIKKQVFADKIGVSRDTVYNWTDENIKVSVLLKICQFFAVDPLYFLDKTKGVAEPAAEYGITGKNRDYVLTETITALNETVDILKGNVKDLRRENETLTALFKQKQGKPYLSKKK